MIIGAARHGKDTIAGMIRELVPRTCFGAFAEPFKLFLQEVYDFTDDQIWGPGKDEPDYRYPRTCKTCNGAKVLFVIEGAEDKTCTGCEGTGVEYMIPREPQQKIGSQVGRECWPLTWPMVQFRNADRVLNRARPISKGDDAGSGTSGKGSYLIEKYDLFVIKDGRFVNEARAGKDVGARRWRVRRPGVPGLKGALAKHGSELEQYSAAMDALVQVDFINDGTLDDLRAKVKYALTLPWDAKERITL